MTSRSRTALCAGIILVMSGAHAGAVPSGPPPVVAVAEGACSPSTAWISTERGDRWLTSPSSICYRPGLVPGAPWNPTFGDGPLIGSATPRLVLTVGETVTLHFAAATQSVVLLRTLALPRATKGRQFRLSPFAPTWRVRKGRGVLDITTTELFSPPAESGVATVVVPVGYAAVYGTRARRGLLR